ncbi:GumC family protein [Ascidiimonas aurantiaca]|uniref:GumC family protein n=1 Tax=Ascidiimonas aurantiaca TaxID=1685432 RepID=UPI0030ED4801
MLENELDIKNFQNTFEIKGFLFRILRFWYIIVLSIFIALGIAYYVNLRAERQYRMETLISIKEEQNPFFTSTLNLTFNWGGASDKVETIRTILGSRSHNEEVVRLLQLYVHYMKEGRFRLEDIHTDAPFIADIDETAPQLLNVPVKIKFLDNHSFELSYTPEENEANTINYAKGKVGPLEKISPFKGTFKMNEPVTLPFLSFVLKERDERKLTTGSEYYLKFTDINKEIRKYRDVRIDLKTKGASMLILSKTGANRDILSDYLNATVNLLSIKQLEQKNLFATNTVNFIDQRIKGVSDSLKQDEDRLKVFRQENKIFDLSSKGTALFEKMTELDRQKNEAAIKLAYLDQLDNYLRNSTDYSELPAPAASGLDDPNLVLNITEMVNLSVQRSNLRSKVKNPLFYEKIDREIDALKSVLFENVANVRASVQIVLNSIDSRIKRFNYEYSKLPAEEQQLFNIERSYKISEASYNMLLEKRNEAGIVKAANVSDIRVIDPARNLNQPAISPDPLQNYMMATFAGLLAPVLVILFISFIDTSIRDPQEIERLSSLPVLGVVGRSYSKGNLAVLEKPRSAVSEAFRSIRSSLQYFYRSRSLEGSKIIMITSSISGEGKTFCSINIASVFALSNKKTVLVGLDLRKPRIFDDFKIVNSKGVVNYLIGEQALDNIVQHTRFDNLDVITSGPVPPNPSELLISERMTTFINELKDNYEYIILDTPPLGLVSDALGISMFADASLYVVRQGKTRKGMLQVINDKYRKGEVKNISFVLNDYRHKSQYAKGHGYAYGYGYGYGGYGQGYHEDDRKRSIFTRLFKRSKKGKE